MEIDGAIVSSSRVRQLISAGNLAAANRLLSLTGNQTISIFVEKNPMPLAASFAFANGALPQVRVPLKMAETSRVRAVVKATDGKLWHAQREIKVTLGGCGG